MGFAMGEDAKLYYAEGGIGIGAWTVIDNAKDVTVTLESSEADASTRGNAGWTATVAVRKNMTFEWEMVWDTADAGFTVIRNAWLNKLVLGIRALDQEAGQGPQADSMITRFSRNEPLDGVLTVSVSAKPTYSETPPSWVT